MDKIRNLVAAAAIGSMLISQPLAATRSAAALPMGASGLAAGHDDEVDRQLVLYFLLAGALAALLIHTLDNDDGAAVPLGLPASPG